MPPPPRPSADRRLAGPVLRALGQRRRADVRQLAVDAVVELGGWRAPGGVPASSTVQRALSAAPAAHPLPDGTWVHVPAVVDGRVLTAPTRDRAGVVCLDGALAAVARRFHRWQRIPVAVGGRWGVGELVDVGGRTVLALPLPVPLVPSPAWVLTVAVGPEGLRLQPAPPDAAASAAMDVALAETPRSWAPVDRLLMALARDGALCGGAAVSTTAQRPADVRTGAGLPGGGGLSARRLDHGSATAAAR